MLNISTRRVGGLRFVKIGRFCFSFCITRAYRDLNQPKRTAIADRQYRYAIEA